MGEETVPEITLKGIISQVLDALIKANSLIDNYNNKLKSVEERESSADQRESILNKKEGDFSKREAEVLHVEDVVSLKKSADELMKDVQNNRNQLAIDTKAFNDYKVSETNKLNELRVTTQRESDNLIQQKKLIDDEVNKRVTEALKNMGIKIKE